MLGKYEKKEFDKLFDAAAAGLKVCIRRWPFSRSLAPLSLLLVLSSSAARMLIGAALVIADPNNLFLLADRFFPSRLRYDDFSPRLVIFVVL